MSRALRKFTAKYRCGKKPVALGFFLLNYTHKYKSKTNNHPKTRYQMNPNMYSIPAYRDTSHASLSTHKSSSLSGTLSAQLLHRP